MQKRVILTFMPLAPGGAEPAPDHTRESLPRAVVERVPKVIGFVNDAAGGAGADDAWLLCWWSLKTLVVLAPKGRHACDFQNTGL
jgi:hypothetical protein